MERKDRRDRPGDGTSPRGGRARTGGKKFGAEDVVRRDLTVEEMEAPRFVNRQLAFYLDKNRDSLPRLDAMWLGLAEETRTRWRRSYRTDMEELRRIGALREAGKMDEAGERTYGELLVVLRRAVPTLRRLGLAQPPVPLDTRPPNAVERRARMTKNATEGGGLSAEERLDRRAGALQGLAVGDALGATYEFCAPDDVPDGPLEIVGGGWLSLAPGETTDDTALAGCVLEGYRPDGSFALAPVRDAMIRWLDSDPKDVGNQTRYALGYLRANPPETRAPEDASAQGNGAVMRAASHGVGAPGPQQAALNAYLEAGLTHPSREARASSALVADLVRLLSDGDPDDPGAALGAAYGIVEGVEGGVLRPGRSRPLREVFAPLEGYRHDPGGWTVYTTRLALFSLVDAPGFRTGVERVVGLGGDADTNAAVAGALLGSRFGASSIPEGWLGSLKGPTAIELLRSVSPPRRDAPSDPSARH